MRRFTSASAWLGSGIGSCSAARPSPAALPTRTRARRPRASRSAPTISRTAAARSRCASSSRPSSSTRRTPRVQYALADAYLARGKRAEAELHVRRALELFPDYHDARLFLSALLLIEKRYADAIPECDRLIDDPTFASPWRALTNRAWAEYKLGRDEAGARIARRTRASTSSNYWPATLALAILEGDAGRRPEAIRLYQDIIAQSPGRVGRVRGELPDRRGLRGARQAPRGDGPPDHVGGARAREPVGEEVAGVPQAPALRARGCTLAAWRSDPSAV